MKAHDAHLLHFRRDVGLRDLLHHRAEKVLGILRLFHHRERKLAEFRDCGVGGGKEFVDQLRHVVLEWLKAR